MKGLLMIIPKKTFWLVIFLLILVTGLTAAAFLNRQQGKQSLLPRPVVYQSPTPSTHLTNLQITQIGLTTPQDLASKYPSASREVLGSGDQRYTIPSQIDTRPNEVLFHGDKAVFERTIIVQSQDKTLTISGLIASLGQPEKIAPGSKFYGYYLKTYIYASKGIAFIGIPDINEVFELQSFVPSSIDEYMRNYGEDIYQTQRRGEGP